jgi:hypothetical protein
MSAIKIKVFRKLYPEQKAIARDALNGFYNFLVIKAGRQAGKSFCLDRIGISISIRNGNHSLLWITPSHGQSKDAFERIESLTKDIPDMTYNRSNNDRHITFGNKSVISFYSAERYDNLRGKNPNAVILDEFAYFKDGAFEYAIKPYFIANKNMKVIAASTPAGKGDFWKLFNKGALNEKNYISHSLHYSMNPKANLEFINSEKSTMAANTFKQEYEGEFIFGESTVFGNFMANQVITEYKEPTKEHKHYFGIDWSTGGSGDKTVITIINEIGEVVYVYECVGNNEIKQSKELVEIIKRYNAIGYAENNGIGSTCNSLLINNFKGGYSSSVLTRFNTSQDSKQKAVQMLILDINTNDVKLPTSNLCPKLDNELSIYQVKRNKNNKLSYSHPSNRHDDYVDSLWLANKARHKLGNVSVRSGGRTPEVKERIFSNDNVTKNSNIPSYMQGKRRSIRSKIKNKGIFG